MVGFRDAMNFYSANRRTGSMRASVVVANDYMNELLQKPLHRDK